MNAMAPCTTCALVEHETLLFLLIWVLRGVHGEESVFVGGWGNWKYLYEPALLPLPPHRYSVEHAHGITWMLSKI